ncbi:hypothetical protein O6H91_18G078100 [Diphasiastrum complanatum]|uniref:Uncharacterized protein n=1 Tax=Diphasiastrum complanatum TaxID=34168 RepID=A0ACC2B433_DIPCM|nr:hypothetical protein O6H91_18G078100 [Diphasiastrum complanatum]
MYRQAAAMAAASSSSNALVCGHCCVCPTNNASSSSKPSLSSARLQRSGGGFVLTLPPLNPGRVVLKGHVTCMGLKVVDSYDSSFELQPECDQILRRLLSSQVFCKQVSEQPGVDSGSCFEFTGELFQPVPWSITTKHGMPQEFEKYLEDKENYVIINVPPNFMFKAKIFKPSRLCAVYRKAIVPTSAGV